MIVPGTYPVHFRLAQVGQAGQYAGMVGAPAFAEKAVNSRPVLLLEPPEIREAVMDTAEAVREAYTDKRKK
ncbi:MAG: hypothetical protein ACE5LA_01010 [Dehalococcoidales bacterium]